MKIKITPFSPKQKNAKGSFRIDNFYYLAEFHSAGMITEIKKDDNFLLSEMGWISRSEVPFVTALRLSQFKDVGALISRASPIIRRFTPFFVIEDRKNFPSDEESRQIIYKYCDLVTDERYDFLEENIDKSKIKQILKRFDYEDDLIIRAGSCLYKAYLLLDISSATFAEEIYTNIFVALEAIINHLVLKNKCPRKEVKDLLNEKLAQLHVCPSFIEYEEEMRESIRNNIIHPYRYKTKKTNASVSLMADYIYEDLPFVDSILFYLLKGTFYIN